MNFEIGRERIVQREKREMPPLAELQFGKNEKLLFVPIDQFPDSQEEQETVVDSKRIVQSQEYQSETYTNTLRITNWESKLFNVVEKYITTELGRKTLEQLEIDDIRTLTPKKAILLTNTIVRDLTRYSYKDIYFSQDVSETWHTSSDKSDAISLLNDGLENYENDAWDGNGVCRQFATMTKLLFEAIKHMQSTTYLRNTHCLIKSGWEHEERRRKAPNALIHTRRGYTYKETPHAWNAFLQEYPNGETMVGISDVTWSEKNASGKLEKLDYTSTRSEPFVYYGMQKFGENDQKMRNSGIEYYTRRFASISRTNDPQKEYIAWRFLLAIPTTTEAVSEKLPEEFKKYLAQVIEESGKELNKGMRDWRKLWEEIRKARILGIETTNIINLFFENHKADEITKIDQRVPCFFSLPQQAAIIEDVSVHPSFAEAVRRNPKLRIIVREVHPEMLYPFRPDREESDLEELIFLVKDSHILHTAVKKFLREKKGKSSATHLAREDATTVKKIANDLLEKRNPTEYNRRKKEVSSWGLIRNFNEYWEDLGSKNQQTT